MQALRIHIALLLLLCLTRTLLPEAWVLALHGHAHTETEAAHEPAYKHKGKALISTKHQHCDVEHFYDVAFQASVPVLVPGPRVAPRYAPARLVLAVSAASGLPTPTTALRGPPCRA